MFGCAGYEPLFSTKNLSFYVSDIENINGDNITKDISRNLNNNKLKKNDKKNYKLKISSSRNNNITSRDTKGIALTYEMIVNVEVEVFNNNSDFPLDTLNFNKNFNYNNQVNKFNLSEYKKGILKNIINKISQEIVIKLQSL
jgi:outer membrane lipopolysaccharide assembly protein LptE/RlpB